MKEVFANGSVIAMKQAGWGSEGAFVVQFLVTLVVAFSFSSSLVAEPHAGKSAGQRLRQRLEAKEHKIKSEEKIEVLPACLDKDREDLLNRLNAGQEVPFHELTEHFIRMHVREEQRAGNKNASIDDLKVFLAKLAARTSRGDIHQMKEEYEKAMEGIAKSPTLYNLEATSLVDVCKTNKLQCYSGTSLNQVITRTMLSMDGFRKNNPVVIFESGHVLPGYVTSEDGKWHLWGIETTASGPAKLDYGLTGDLKRDVRVVDAEDWLLTEVFKDCIKDGRSLVESHLKKVFDKYGIVQKPASLEEFTEKGGDKGGINGSLYGFGKPTTPPGDLKRDRINQTKAQGHVGPRVRHEMKLAPDEEMILGPMVVPNGPPSRIGFFHREGFGRGKLDPSFIILSNQADWKESRKAVVEEIKRRIPSDDKTDWSKRYILDESEGVSQYGPLEFLLVEKEYGSALELVKKHPESLEPKNSSQEEISANMGRDRVYLESPAGEGAAGFDSRLAGLVPVQEARPGYGEPIFVEMPKEFGAFLRSLPKEHRDSLLRIGGWVEKSADALGVVLEDKHLDPLSLDERLAEIRFYINRIEKNGSQSLQEFEKQGKTSYTATYYYNLKKSQRLIKEYLEARKGNAR